MSDTLRNTMTTKRRYTAGLGAPETLAGGEPPREVVTFRLGPAEFVALRELAERAGLGHATLCRRVIEEYVAQHARRRR